MKWAVLSRGGAAFRGASLLGVALAVLAVFSFSGSATQHRQVSTAAGASAGSSSHVAVSGLADSRDRPREALDTPTSTTPPPEPAAPAPARRSQVVAIGDTASAIAGQHGLPLEALVHLNPGLGSNPDLIFPGEVLALEEGAPSRLEARGPPVPPAPPIAAAALTSSGRYGSSTHAVAAGETATSIAALYGLPLEILIRLNPGLAANPNLIFVGEVLALKEGAPSRLQARATAQPQVATVPAARTMGVSRAAPASGVFWTFDDCEAFIGQGTVRRYIQTLHAHGIGRAIFFMTGDCYRSRPDLVAVIRQFGYEIGNHTAHHPNLVLLSLPAVEAEVRGGPPGARYFRPPYGAHTAAIDSLVARLGYSLMLWTLDSGDTSPATRGSCNAILANLQSGVRPGSIVLMHMHNPNSCAAMAAYLAGRASC